VDDERIRQLTAEVVNHLRGTTSGAPASDLEPRVAALEAAVARLERAGRDLIDRQRARRAHRRFCLRRSLAEQRR
jgi:hypothetical protein